MVLVSPPPISKLFMITLDVYYYTKILVCFNLWGNFEDSVSLSKIRAMIYEPVTKGAPA